VIEELFPSLKQLTYLFTHKSENGRVVAHCLDLDLVAVGPDFETAEHRLNFLVSGHIASAIATGSMLLLAHKAPQSYWDKVKGCPTLQTGTLEVNIYNPISANGEIGVVKADCMAVA